MSLKIVVIGDVAGSFKEVFEKLNALHQKNNFAFAIIAGSLFESVSDGADSSNPDVQDLLQGNVDLKVPTYFALGRHAFPPEVVDVIQSRDGELCENLHFLGRRATMKTSDGIRIVALGGQLDANIINVKSDETHAPFYSQGDANALKGANSADILVTTDWPASIWNGATASDDIKNYGESHAQECIAMLNAKLRPRYHFSTSARFFEREPFSHRREGDDPGFAITRFISLAPYGNLDKQKWIYAFMLDTARSLPHELPPNCTASPLTQATSTKRTAEIDASQTFSRYARDEPRRSGKKRKGPPPGPFECFFCFSNPNVAQHLVCAIGNEAYMTMAKGPLTRNETFGELGFNCHVLIIPMAHAATFASIPDRTQRSVAITEMNRYRSALHGLVAGKSAGRLGAITWEVSRSTGVHTHWQFLPVPVDLIRRGLAEAAFKVEAENEGYPTLEPSNVGPDEEEESDCFKLWLWTPSASEDVTGPERRLILPLDSGFKFDIQFGRRVLGKLLGLDDRLSWRSCVQSEVEEIADTEAFKAAFETHDPFP